MKVKKYEMKLTVKQNFSMNKRLLAVPYKLQRIFSDRVLCLEVLVFFNRKNINRMYFISDNEQLENSTESQGANNYKNSAESKQEYSQFQSPRLASRRLSGENQKYPIATNNS